MPPYTLTPQSEEDIKDVARYTLKQWGKKPPIIIAVLHERMNMLVQLKNRLDAP